VNTCAVRLWYCTWSMCLYLCVVVPLHMLFRASYSQYLCLTKLHVQFEDMKVTGGSKWRDVPVKGSRALR
jgi:hypothetical protein